MNDDFSECLTQLGWDSFFENNFQLMNIPGSVPARVISESKNSYRILCRYGELSAVMTGKMRRLCETENIRPAVGDWVVVIPLLDEQKCLIHAVLPRKSKFSRKVAGECAEEQIVAANVDTVFIVSGLDGGRSFNLRRIERYLALAWNSGATPVVVLNKSDLCSDADTFIQAVETVAPGISVLAVSARNGSGLDALRAHLGQGITVAFLGSSGAGKSALINALLGSDRQVTGAVRDDDRQGRHTTTRREIILLPGSGAVIDTPGMREIQMWPSEGDIEGAFSDIEALVGECRFKNCSHNNEPGCAVIAAVGRGDLDPVRLESYWKLKKELEYIAEREENGARMLEKNKWKKVAQWSKQMRK